jgi:hypothetical protein
VPNLRAPRAQSTLRFVDLAQAAAELQAEVERVKKLSTFAKLDALPGLIDRQLRVNSLMIAELGRVAGRSGAAAGQSKTET